MNLALATLDLGTVDVVAVVFKALSLIALLQALGLATFGLIYGAELCDSLAALRTAIRRSCVAGIVLLIVNQCLVAARMGSEWPALFDLGLQSAGWHSSQAVATLMRVIALLCIAVGIARESGVNRSWLAPSMALLLISFTIAGHVSVHPLRPILIPLIVAHIVLIAYWLGGVRGLMLTLRGESQAVSATIANRFSVHAVIAVPFIAVAGAAMAAVLLSNFAALLQPYGLLLSAKLLCFMLLMLLAAINKFVWVPALQRHDGHAASRFRHVLKAEYAVLVAVLVATAAMTSWFSPQ